MWVEVGPDRFARWCDGFAQRHDGLAHEPRLVTDEASDGAEAVELAAADGSTATCHVPFPPLSPAPCLDFDPATAPGTGTGTGQDAGPDVGPDANLIDRLVAHALADRTVGVLLVRRGGFAVGVFEGTRLAESKIGARHVQGRTKAGGWSQQRFARRREGQAREAYAAAADTAARLLLPRAADLDALVVGGDAGAISALRTDVRLKPLWPKETTSFVNVGDPKAADLLKAREGFRAVRIRLVEQS